MSVCVFSPYCVRSWVLCCVASPCGGDGGWHRGLLSVRGRRVLIFNWGRLYLERAASPSPRWTAQRRCRPSPLWRKAVGGSRTSLSLPDRISLQMSFKTRHVVFLACVFVCECVCVLTISNLSFSLEEMLSQHALHPNSQAHCRAFRYNCAQSTDWNISFIHTVVVSSWITLASLVCVSVTSCTRLTQLHLFWVTNQRVWRAQFLLSFH